MPCLSFDVIIDDLGCGRSDFPHSMYLVAGSQAEKPKDNCVFVMKVCTHFFQYIENSKMSTLNYVKIIITGLLPSVLFGKLFYYSIICYNYLF